MNDYPQGMKVDPESATVAIGDIEIPFGAIAQSGPIVVQLDRPRHDGEYRGAGMSVAWIPVYFEGQLDDPDMLCRVVDDGDQYVVSDGVPEVPDPEAVGR